MNRILYTSAIGLLVGFFFYVSKPLSIVATTGEVHRDAPVRADIKTTPAKSPAARESTTVPRPLAGDDLKKVQAELTALSEQQAQIDQELRNLGFPDALNDERLRESERTLILAKLNSLSEMQTRVNDLRFRKIDLETGGDR